MGNSAAGARASGHVAEQHAIEIEVTNQLGLPLTLVEESFSEQGHVTKIPREIASVGKLQVAGAQPAGHVVFHCSVAVCRSNVQSKKIDEKASDRCKTHHVDLRSAKAEQCLTLVVTWAWGQPVLRFAATYGSGVAHAAVKQTTALAKEDAAGEDGMCSWTIHPRTSPEAPTRVCLHVRKTQAAVLARRTGLLDKLEQDGAERAEATRAAVEESTRKAMEARAAVEQERKAKEAEKEALAAVEATGTGPEKIPDLADGLSAEEQGRSEPTGDAKQCLTAQAREADPNLSARPADDVKRERTDGASGTEASTEAGRPAVDGVQTSTSVESCSEECSGSSETQGQRQLFGLGRLVRKMAPREAEDASVRREKAARAVEARLESSAQNDEPEPVTAKPTTTDEAGAESNGKLQNSRRSRSGALALRARAEIEAAEERRRLEAQRIRDAEAAAAQMLLDDRLLRASQDQEFQQSLLTDQLKDYTARQAELQKKLESLEDEISESEKIYAHATQRLQRFGDNPKFQSEAERAATLLTELKDKTPEITGELAGVEVHIAHLNELLGALLV